MSAPCGDPAYNPVSWKLGYQSQQFGVGVDALASGTTASNHQPSAYAAMANPPANLTTGVTMPIPTAPVITPDQ